MDETSEEGKAAVNHGRVGVASHSNEDRCLIIVFIFFADSMCHSSNAVSYQHLL